MEGATISAPQIAPFWRYISLFFSDLHQTHSQSGCTLGVGPKWGSASETYPFSRHGQIRVKQDVVGLTAECDAITDAYSLLAKKFSATGEDNVLLG